MNARADLQTLLLNDLDAYQAMHGLCSRERQVCEHIKSCRTPAMGGRQLRCSDCEYTMPQFHSCRDRHCPKCQRAVSKQWCKRQAEQVLPVTYHHLVFTLPSSLNQWVSKYPEVVYHQLFQCVWQTLKGMGADPKRLNGQMGLTAVLHTWGENMSRHVHLHCLVPGGAMSAEGQWQKAPEHYLFPVRALSRLYRGKMVSALRRAATQGQLKTTSAAEVKSILDGLMSKEWVVFSKPCPNKIRTIVDYLGRYSHRIAISDQRLKSLDGGKVRFSMKDYRDGGVRKDMTLSAEEFIRRFLLHVLPKGLMRIRHYGFLSNRNRRSALPRLRASLVSPSKSVKRAKTENVQPVNRCPRCKQSQLEVLYELLPKRLREA